MDSNLSDSEVSTDSADDVLAPTSENLKNSTESRKAKVDKGITHFPIKNQTEPPSNESLAPFWTTTKEGSNMFLDFVSAKPSSSRATDLEPLQPRLPRRQNTKTIRPNYELNEYNPSPSVLEFLISSSVPNSSKTHNEPLANTNSNSLDAYQAQLNFIQEISNANMAQRLKEALDAYEVSQNTHNEPLAETNSNLLDAYREQWNLLQELSDANMARLLEEELNAHESEVSQYKHNLPADKNIECVICRENFLLGNGIRCQKQKIKENLGVDFHEFCRDCVKNYIEATVDTIQLAETKDGIKCMGENCNKPICYASFRTLLSEATRRRFEERMQQENLAQIASLERCKNCLFAMEIEGHPLVVQFFTCPICYLHFCRLCKRDAAVHFEKTCEEIDLQEAEAERERIRVQQVQYHDEMAEIISRRCKNCSTPIIKSTGCNKLICRCGTTMCYWCGASNINSDHFRQGPCRNKLHDEGYQERDNQAVEAIRQRMNHL